MSNDQLRYNAQPLILLICNEAPLVEQLATTLTSTVFRVVIAHDERDALDKAQRHRPHGIVLDVRLASAGYALCRTLRAVSPAPIVLVSPGQPTRADTLEAVRAGAWELRGTPIDNEDFLARLSAFVAPMLELDRVSGESLVDRVSGLYNLLGLTKRADELAELATRHGLALACMVFRPVVEPPTEGMSEVLATTFKSVGRASDAVGRTGRAEYAVFAPARNGWSAGRLVSRLTIRASSYGDGIIVRSGFSSASPAHKIPSHTLLAQARSALEATSQSHL